MGINSFFKMNGKSLKNFMITGALFVLFIFTSLIDPSNETEHNEVTEKDKNTNPTIVNKTVHTNLVTCQKEKTKIAKPTDNNNLIKSNKSNVRCKSIKPKKVKIEKGTYRIVFMVYGFM